MRERDGSVDTVDGWETVESSLGGAPLGWSETEAWTPWTDGKPREIAGESSVVRERDGSVDIVDGWEAVGIAWGELRWEEATYWGAELLARVLRTNSINDAIFREKKTCVRQRLFKWCAKDMHSFVGREGH